MRTEMKKFLTIFLCMALLSTGCAFNKGVSPEAVEAKKRDMDDLTRSRIVNVHNTPYMRAVPVKPSAKIELPGEFAQQITFNDKGSLRQICASISSLTGLLIFAPDISSASGGTDSGGNMDSQLLTGLDPARPPRASMYSRGSGGIRVAFSGTISGLFDVVASHFGVSWEYNAKSHAIEFLASNVKTFTILAAPGKVSHASKVSNESKGSSGGDSGESVQESSGETAQSTDTDISIDIWTDIVAEVKALLTKDGSVTANQIAGTITVRDTPVTLRQVGDYVDEINKRLSRQIALSIKVWSLEVSDATDVGVDLSLFFDAPDVQVFTGASPLSMLPAGGDLSAAVVNGRLKNSSALLKGLRALGRATQVTSGGGVVMSNQPVPIQAIKRDAYLASSSQSTSEYGNTTELTPGEITTGFAMTVIPYVLENRRVILQYSVDLSSLDELVSFESGDATIQLPKVSKRNLGTHSMALKMGQTLVLAGFEQEVDNRGTSGGFLGFNKSQEYKKSLLIITISTEAGDV